MKQIVEDNGKYYAEDVIRMEEVTAPILAEKLTALKSDKEKDLAERAAEWDAMIADMQRQMDDLAALKT